MIDEVDWIDWSAFNKELDETEFEITMECVKKMEYEHRLRFVHRWKIFTDTTSRTKKHIYLGRRFGKTRLTSLVVATICGGEEGRRKAIEFWQKVDRGEIE